MSSHSPFRTERLCAGIVLGFCVAYSVAAWAEENGTVARKANQATKRGAGSACMLRGHVVLFELFVQDPVSEWPKDQRQEVNQRVEAAITFLQQQAKRHDRAFTIQRVSGPDARLREVIPTDPHANPDWSEKAIEAATGLNGQAVVRNLVQERLTRRRTTEVAICLHVNRAGISYNLAYYDRVDPIYSAERMICFRTYPDGRATAAASYAHELLHLFGAGDLYFPYDDSNDRLQEAKESFPSDIMFRVDYDIDRLNVGPFTAFRIGWSDSLDPRWKHLED
jgi:hypothetical protein